MNHQLISAALSLEAKADAAKEQAILETDAALAENSIAGLQLAAQTGLKSVIYREVAATLREAAASPQDKT